MKTLFIISFLMSSLVLAKASNTGTSSGRFQMIQLSDFASHQYLLDTQTGRIWNRQCSVAGSNPSGCDLYVWSPEDIIEITTSGKKHIELIEKIEASKKQKEIQN